MKVCHLISGDLWAGAEVQAFTMIKSLATLPDMELSAIILNEGTLANKLKATGIKVTVCDESRLSFIKLYRTINQILNNDQVDIVHSHRYKENILAGLLKRAGTVGHLVKTVHGLSEVVGVKPQIKSRVFRIIDDFLTRRYFDKILPVSHDIKRVLQHRFDPSRVITIHNAIDPDIIKIIRSPETIRDELGIKPDQPVIGTAGRMVPIKGYDQFLQTAKIILESSPDTMFVIAGDGPLLDELKHLASELDIANKVIFTGFREDIIDLINSFDLFLMSSYHEGIPMVILEAMSLGKMVVSFDVGGIGEIIDSGRSGFLVKAEDTSALANACLDIMGNNELKEQIASAVTDRIKDEFSIDSQRERLEEIYSSLNTRTPVKTDL